ncbi:MAG: DUF2057 domain-containing protein [[Pasteurella] mairii]|uniref:UPF0319 protein NCTC10699_00694 n=1 Tax=[Pasteurella] mairii TaxID=757 RepID=A0A379B388_9PAST|nr:DUF2057 domain-containing protein [[Pasteurella] mairii]SUB33095.1 Uncharacterized protein conserved in bacteria (DUF2057) [[Pasteurella] mairii]
MKFRSAALATTALLMSTASFAGVVTSSTNIEFLAIDGKKPATSLLKSTNSFNVNDSQMHQVVVRVTEIIRAGSDRELFESDPIIISFQGSQEDVVISAPRIEDERDAKNFKKNPTISVKTVSGREIATKQDTLAQEGFLPGVNLVNTLSDYNTSGAVASVSSLATTAVPAAVPGFATKANKGKVVVQGENVAEQQLQYWFQQADKETQARFLDWAKKLK